MTIGTHLDLSLKVKIELGDYVDFAKLLPKDRIRCEDSRMELVNRGGQSFWILVVDREVTSINSYSQWEQAFRIYMNVFAKANPHRVTELIQYYHLIETAAASFQWENVYRYDREFRIHMALHPERNWGGDPAAGLVTVS